MQSMTPTNIDEALDRLKSLNASQPLSILTLVEPISDGAPVAVPASAPVPTPASLDADLTHYRELFAKLRFSYVEQVTKEKFIRAIVGDPPQIVSPGENAELERRNAAAKAELAARKADVAGELAELEATGRGLARRHDDVAAQSDALAHLPGRIAALEAALVTLREARARGRSANPEMNLPLFGTLRLLEEKTTYRDGLERQLRLLQSLVPSRKMELDRVYVELQPLEKRRQNTASIAKEARRRKEAALGGFEDGLEERGRWLRAAGSGLAQMLDAEVGRTTSSQSISAATLPSQKTEA